MLHAMEFVGPPFIFNFRQLGSNCGIAGQHAAIELDGRVFWMGAKDFFVYDGAGQSFTMFSSSICLR